MGLSLIAVSSRPKRGVFTGAPWRDHGKSCVRGRFDDATGQRARYDLRRWLVANDPSKLTTNTTKTAAARMTTITG